MIARLVLLHFCAAELVALELGQMLGAKLILVFFRGNPLGVTPLGTLHLRKQKKTFLRM